MSRSGLPPYLSASELHARLADPDLRAKTLIVDVRDDDRQGGHVAGSLHVPSESFARSHAVVRKAAQGKELVVFHCMQSQMRGPTCAAAMAAAVAKDAAADAAKDGSSAFPPIVILEYGFAGWARYVSRLEPEVLAKDRAILIDAYKQDVHGYRC